MTKEKMVSVRLPLDLLADLQAEATETGSALSEVIRRRASHSHRGATITGIRSRIDSVEVPSWPGMQNPGHHHVCKVCGVRTSGPSDPLYTGHGGGCEVYKDIVEVLG